MNNLVNLDNLKLENNIEYTWNESIEKLMKQWGEKSAGLRYMHNISSHQWKNLADNLTLISIIITSLASTISLISTNIENENTQNILIYFSGFITILSSLLQTLKKFYNAEEKSAEHNLASKQFGSIYRYLTLQLNMERNNRDPVNNLCNFTLKEYEKLQKEAPLISKNIIDEFKEKFKNSNQSYPDIAEDKFIINIHNTNYNFTDISNNTNNTNINDISNNTNNTNINDISNNTNINDISNNTNSNDINNTTNSSDTN